MPVPNCVSGDCVNELNTLMSPGLNVAWPSSRLQIENALKVLLSFIGNVNVAAQLLPNGTAPKDFRATAWPSGLPNATTFPYLAVVVDGDIWVAPNNTAYDIGTVPATLGTGTKWVNINATPVQSQRLAQGRLTLTSGTPVTTSDVLAATTLYYTPYIGNLISIWNGTKSVDYVFSETPLALTGLTAGLNYDIFGYINTGVLALEAVPWSTDTARATAISRVADGYWVKSTNTQRRLLGTIRTSAIGQTEDSLAKRFVNNLYNTVPRSMQIYDSTVSWSTSGAVDRIWNNNAANKVEFVRCVNESPVHMGGQAYAIARMGTTAGTKTVYVSLVLDAVTQTGTYTADIVQNSVVSTSVPAWLRPVFDEVPGLGYHYVALVETSASLIGTFLDANGVFGNAKSKFTGWVLG